MPPFPRIDRARGRSAAGTALHDARLLVFFPDGNAGWLPPGQCAATPSSTQPVPRHKGRTA